MKLLLRFLILLGFLLMHLNGHAQGSMLRVTCEGADVGAEVSVNGVFKGECPLDMSVGAGTFKLRLVKKVESTREKIFEQEVRMGDGVVKKIEARLGPAQFTADGQRIEAERERQAADTRRQEQEAARVREDNRQRELALAEQRRIDMQARALAEFKAQGIEPGNGKSFRDCPECPEMVLVPPGQLPQRIPPANALIAWLNQVTIANPLAIGKFEVTYDEWEACVAGGACSPMPEGVTSGVFTTTRWGKGRQPVIFPQRSDALAYLAWLSKKTGHSYRLLSLAEFTYAARGGRSSKLPWGDEVGSNNANCKNCDFRLGGSQPAPVGSFAANGWGLHDMLGNVSEMVADCSVLTSRYAAMPKDGSPSRAEHCAITSPPARREFLGDSYVAMGASWNDNIGSGIPISDEYEKNGVSTRGLRVARTLKSKAPDAGLGK